MKAMHSNPPRLRALTDLLAKTRWTLDPSREAALRAVKGARNLIVDPFPRSQELLYEGYDLSYPDIAYRFRLRSQTFVHRIVFDDLGKDLFGSLEGADWAPLLHHIGLLFAPYHFRLTDLAGVRVTCTALPDDVRDFHQETARSVLAEFRYRFGLDARRPIGFRSDVQSDLSPARRVLGEEKVLLLNGGGKDSIVAAELLRAIDMPFAWFTLKSSAVSNRVVAASRKAESYHATYRLDPAFERHARYSWGPTLPHTALISSVALVPAVLHRFRFVAIGNEYSANFPTRMFRGIEVNHQYGKSYDFEKRLGELVNRRLVDGVTYFSVLRPFYEVRLGALFTRFEQYLEAFISCNEGIRKGLWCKACPKCAFVFLVLYPFLDSSQRERVFGEDLFYRSRIRTLMLDLTKPGRKPWECVGTPEESQLALFLSLQKSPELAFHEWPYRVDLERACAGLDVQAASRKYLHGFHRPHCLPPGVEARLKSAADRLTPGEALMVAEA